MMFRIYYGDGSVFEGEDPEDIVKRDNVQAIAWNDPEKGYLDIGRLVLSEWDIYIYSDHVGGWHGTSKYADLLRHLRRGCGPGGVRCVLEGEWIDRDRYLEIKYKADHDSGLNRKSAIDPVREDGSE